MSVSIKVVLFFLWLFQVFIQHSGSSNIRLDEFALVFHFEDSSCKTMDRSSDTRHKYAGIPPPLYVLNVLEQAIRLHSSTDVKIVYLTNARECHLTSLWPYMQSMQSDSLTDRELMSSRVYMVDIWEIASQHTRDFMLFSKTSIFSHMYNKTSMSEWKPHDVRSILDKRKQSNNNDVIDDKDASLYGSSMMRFFSIHDLMLKSQSNDGVSCVNKAYINGVELTSNLVLKNIYSVLLVESDNLLFQTAEVLLSALQPQYPTLAGVSQSKLHFTASTLWVPSLAALSKLTYYIVSLCIHESVFAEFRYYISIYGSNRRVVAGYPPLDKEGRGIRHFSINEMSLLAYFYDINTEEVESAIRLLDKWDKEIFVETCVTCLNGGQFYHQNNNNNHHHSNKAGSTLLQATWTGNTVTRYIQTLPLFNSKVGLDATNKHSVTNFVSHLPNQMVSRSNQDGKDLPEYNTRVGTDTALNVWDPGSWGQFIAGTYLMHRASHFVDLYHHIGKAIHNNGCRVSVLCSCVLNDQFWQHDYTRKMKSNNSSVDNSIEKSKGRNRFESIYPLEVRSIAIRKDKFTTTAMTSEDLRLRRVHRNRASSLENGNVIALPSEFSEKSVPQEIMPLYHHMGNINTMKTLNSISNSKGNESDFTYYTAPFIQCCSDGDLLRLRQKEYQQQQHSSYNGNSNNNMDGRVKRLDPSTYGSLSCGNFQPLVNLHVHSKNTRVFMSRLCDSRKFKYCRVKKRSKRQ